MNFKKDYKNNVRKYRVWKQLTQQQLADLIGIDVSDLRLIEKQAVIPQLKTREKIIKYFNVSMEQMFYYVIIKRQHGNEEPQGYKESVREAEEYCAKQNNNLPELNRLLHGDRYYYKGIKNLNKRRF